MIWGRTCVSVTWTLVENRHHWRTGFMSSFCRGNLNSECPVVCVHVGQHIVYTVCTFIREIRRLPAWDGCTPRCEYLKVKTVRSALRPIAL